MGIAILASGEALPLRARAQDDSNSNPFDLKFQNYQTRARMEGSPGDIFIGHLNGYSKVEHNSIVNVDRLNARVEIYVVVDESILKFGDEAAIVYLQERRSRRKFPDNGKNVWLSKLRDEKSYPVRVNDYDSFHSGKKVGGNSEQILSTGLHVDLKVGDSFLNTAEYGEDFLFTSVLNPPYFFQRHAHVQRYRLLDELQSERAAPRHKTGNYESGVHEVFFEVFGINLSLSRTAFVLKG